MEVAVEGETEVDGDAERERAWQRLCGAVDQSDCREASRILSQKWQPPLDVNRRTVFQSCLLHLSAKKGDAAMVSLLLDSGADIDAMDFGSLRKTALHHAALSGHLKVIEVLMERIGGEYERVLQYMPSSGQTWDELLDHADRLINVPTEGEYNANDAEYGNRTVSQTLVLMAITKPRWTTRTHQYFPFKFKECVRGLLTLCHRMGVNSDIALLLVQHLAYPLSDWI